MTHFSGRFTIHSPSGFVRGSQTLDQTLSNGVVCDESPGGTSVSTATCQTSFSGEQCSATPVPTRYVARVTNGTRVHVDKGASTVFLDSTAESGVPLNQHSSIRVSVSAKRDARRFPRLPLRPASTLSGSNAAVRRSAVAKQATMTRSVGPRRRLGANATARWSCEQGFSG